MTAPAVSAVITLGEWQAQEFPSGLSFAPEDRALLKQINASGHLQIDELRNGLRVQAFSWVGVVRFSTFEIHIRPKLAGDNIGLVALLDYTHGLSVLQRLAGLGFMVKLRDDYLLDLIVLLFVEEVERVLQRGLLSDYLEMEDDLPVLRGRLLADRQVLLRFGRIDRLECRFDESSTDILENQILAAALAVCAPLSRNAVVRRRVNTLRGVFEGVCTPRKDADTAQIRSTLVYNRLNRSYRDAHHLAWLLLDGLGLHDFYHPGALRCFSFLLDMNILFEQFVTRWLTQILRPEHLIVHNQHRDYSILWDPDRNCSYAAIIPDLLVDAGKGTTVLPVDAKYKLYDHWTVANSDLYQTFLYGFAYGLSDAGLAKAIILYPASSTVVSHRRVQVRRAANKQVSGEIYVCGVHVPTVLGEIKSGVRGAHSQSVVEAVRQAMQPGIKR